ncbi:hypothetical protein BpHYR1_017708 [Brachionus plicatilis]|uniref:Uncharacterized protein n=1 Tax=Brachionus plicatilis TaxID=10195 RepID=A0A3M7PR20_BRAPC|nr:hypothetical protein BpHYR1_017708 [Brachionus plicatilis]
MVMRTSSEKSTCLSAYKWYLQLEALERAKNLFDNYFKPNFTWFCYRKVETAASVRRLRKHFGYLEISKKKFLRFIIIQIPGMNFRIIFKICIKLSFAQLRLESFLNLTCSKKYFHNKFHLFYKYICKDRLKYHRFLITFVQIKKYRHFLILTKKIELAVVQFFKTSFKESFFR